MYRRLNLESLEAREVPAAKMQLIHNSPFANLRNIDVYVNDNLYLNDLPFQGATAFLDMASQTNLKIDITPSDAKGVLASTTLNLPDNSVTVAVAVGNANDGSLKLATASALASGAASNVQFLAFNASPDAGPVDLRLRSTEVNYSTAGDDLAFGKFSSGYVTTASNTMRVQMSPSPGGIPVTAGLNLAPYAGKAAVLMASGFASPPSVSDPKLSIVAVFQDGTSVTLPPQFEPAYAAGTVTAKGGVAIFSSADGTTTQSIIAFPGATSSARVASADLTGDGLPELLAASGPGLAGMVRIFDGATGEMIHEVMPFGNFIGGVNISTGDMTGDGLADYVLSPDDGGGPRVRVFNGATHEQIADYFGIDDVNFRGGARAAIGDLNNDGRGDLVVSAGLGGGPRIAIFDGAQLKTNGGPKFTGDFFAFEPELRNGAFVTAGDINADGFDDLIVGGGPGGGPRVRAFDGKAISNSNSQQHTLADFFAGDVNERLGARVTAKDVDGDGYSDIIAGGIPGGAAVTRVFLGMDLPLSGIGNSAVDTISFDGTAPLGEVFVG